MKFLLPLCVLIAVVLGCGAPAKRSGGTVTPTPARTERPVAADVELSPSGVVVTNTDAIDLPGLTLRLNLTEWGKDDGQISIGTVAAGARRTVPYGEFTVGTARFDPRKTKILTVFLQSSAGDSQLFLCPGATCQPASQ